MGMRNSFAPSVAENGGNMAGKGAFQSYTTPDMQQASSSAAIATGHGLQPRQQYTFGQSVEPAVQVADDGGDDIMEEAHGAYSSQPQAVQAVYNLEAYGDYTSYSNYAQGHAAEAVESEQNMAGFGATQQHAAEPATFGERPKSTASNIDPYGGF
jgi:hypothetical protein